MVIYAVSKFHELWPTNGLNRSVRFAHHSYILHSASLPGVAHGGQQTEHNQTLPNGRRKIALTGCRKSWISPSQKFRGQNCIYLFSVNIFGQKHAMDKGRTVLEIAKGLLQSSDIS